MVRATAVIDQRPAGQATSGRGPRVRRSLNVPLLAATAVALAVLCPGAYLWHRQQMPRIATVMLERADRLEEAQDWRSAAAYLYRYLRLCPEDGKVRARLAEVFDRSAQDDRERLRAVQFYYEAIPVAPPENELALRSRLAEVLLALGRKQLMAASYGRAGMFGSAEEQGREVEKQAQELLKSNPDDPQAKRTLAEACRILALARHGEHQSGELVAKGVSPRMVGDGLERAIKLNPRDLELATTLARVYREEPDLLPAGKSALNREQREQQASQIVDDAVASNPQSPEAYLARYEYRVKYGLPGVDADLQAAVKHGSDSPKVRMAAGEYAYREALRIGGNRSSAERARQLLDAARTHYGRLIELQPTSEIGYVGVGRVELADGKLDRAVEVLQRGIQKAGKETIQLKLLLAESLLQQGQLDLAEAAINVLEQAIAELGPRMRPRARASLQQNAALLRGKWLVQKGRPLAAVSILRQANLSEAGDATEDAAGLQSLFLLGKVYAAVKQWDLAATCYEQVAARQSRLLQPRVLAAAAWENAGRLDAAVRDYRQAATLDGSPERWLDLARAEFRHQVQLSKEERDWEPFRKAFAQATNPLDPWSLADTWRARLLEAEYLVVQGEEQGQRDQKCREAAELLRTTESEFSNSTVFLETLVMLYDRIGAPADADRVLLAIEKLGSAPESACLLRARLHARRKEYDKAGAILRAGVPALSSGSKRALEKELAQLSLLQGRQDEAKELLLALHQKDPSDVEPILQLADLALEGRDSGELQKWEGKLRDLEGPAGLYAQYFEARRRLAESKAVNDAAFAQAVRLQATIQSGRPAWPPGVALRGMLLETQNKLSEAAEAYQESIRLGERRVWAYERLVTVLYRLQRFEEADRYLARLRDQGSSSESLSSLETSIAVQRNQLDRALETARRGVEQRPKDPMARIWLGQVHLARGETDAAGKQFQEAVGLAPGNPRVYDPLFAFYVRLKQPERAREVLGEFSKNAKLTDGERAFAMAQRYELLGDRRAAETQYREAIRLTPGSSGVHVRAAAFFAQTDAGEAEKVLRAALAATPRDRDLRRALAAVLAGRGGHEAWQEAEKLLESSESGGDVSSLDQRLQALLLARRGGRENLRNAVQILERVVADAGQASPNDRILLARLLESDGKLGAARQQYLSALGRPKPDPSHMIGYIDLLLRNNLPAEATGWMTRLEQAAPGDLRTVSLRARWLKAMGRTGEIDKTVDSFAAQAERTGAGDKQREAQFAAGLGNLYSQLEEYKRAERWYRRLKELAPERYGPLAVALARQGRTREAIELCLSAAAAEGSRIPLAMALVGVLVAGHPNKDECFRLAEPALTRALEKHGDNADLLVSVATVRILQQRMDEAERLLRQALGVDGKHVLAMNNLATLLAEKPGGRPEALKLVDGAMDAAGPQPALLDTKGWILLVDGKPGESVRFLEGASSTLDADPRFRFHLALAYERQGELKKARDAFKMVRRAELDRQILTTQEQKMLADLDERLR